MRTLATILALLIAFATPATAQDRTTLGVGRLFNNDAIGDGHDRWRTGSFVVSFISGSGWDGTWPGRFSDLIELRFRTEIIAPYAVGSDGYRPYVGALSYGIHTHSALGGGQLSAGLDITAIGPQTGISGFQDWFHDNFGLIPASGGEDQLPDAIHASVMAEYGYPLQLAPAVTFRPFVEGQAGVENIARIGGDLIWGRILQSDLLLRDVPTGQLYRAIRGHESGFALVAGADWAQVGSSVYLPQDRGVTATDSRTRARIGLHWQPRPTASVFYGLTWLSPEYEGQPEGQVLGSLNVRFVF